MISAVNLDHVKAGLAVVVLLVCLNLVQGSTVVVVLAAMVGYLFLPVLQPTKELFSADKTSAKDALATGRTIKGKRRTATSSRGLSKKGVAVEESSDEDEDESSEYDDASLSQSNKMKLKKLQRKTMQQKPLSKKVTSRKAPPAAPIGAEPAADVMQYAEMVTQQAAAHQPCRQFAVAHQLGVQPLSAQLGDGGAAAAVVAPYVDEAMRGVSHYMELEKRSRAVEQQHLLLGGMQRSPQSQAAKMQVEQAMVQILKCVNSIQRLQQSAPGSAQHLDSPQATPLLDYAVQSFPAEQTKLAAPTSILAAPPGLECKRTTLSATARPFEPIFASPSARLVGATTQ